jgi:hypothetical protein
MRHVELVDLILSLPDARRSQQTAAPEFRVSGRIFATLPSNDRLLLKLTPEQQSMVLKSDPALFAPVEDAWGARGWTYAKVEALNPAAALSALMLAWSNAAPQSSLVR